MKSSMKISLFTILILFSGFGHLHAYKKTKCFMPQAPEINLNGVKQIAVLDFKGSNKWDNDVGKFVADKMVEYLLMDDRGITEISGGFFSSAKEGVTLIDGVGTNCYSVVERSRLESVLAEQSIGEVGLVNEAQAAKVGEILGVEVILFGDCSAGVKESRGKEERTYYKNKQAYTRYVECVTKKVKVVANIRIVNVENGEILGVRNASYAVEDKICTGDDKSGLRDSGEMAGSCAATVAWKFVNLINPWYELEEFEYEKIKMKEFKKKADQAAKAAENYEMDKAYAIYHKLYESDPYNPKFLYNMGVLYETTGDFPHAKEMYEGAVMLKDNKRYKEALDRISRRVTLVPFYASLDMAIVPRDFEAAATTGELTAKKVKVKGKSQDRVEVYGEPNSSSSVIAKVPGEIQLMVLSTQGEWYEVELLGGKKGYIHKSNIKD